MLIPGVQELGRYERVYVSPHLDDAVLSCGAGLLADVDAGLRVLVVTLFTEGPEHELRRREDGAALDPLGIDRLHAGLVDAPWRRPGSYASFEGIVHGRDPGDDPVLARAGELLGAVLRAARPPLLLAPLGVGTHVDHRLAFEAALALPGAPLLFYEDMPYALAEGATMLRLLELGADPGAIPRPGRDRILAAFRALPYVRRYLGAAEATRCEAALLAPLAGPPPRTFTAEPSVEIHDPAVRPRLEAMVAAHASQIAGMLGDLGAFLDARALHAATLAPGATVAERRWRLRPAALLPG